MFSIENTSYYYYNILIKYCNKWINIFMDKCDDIKIVFENDDLVVLNKPSGVLMHPTRTSKEDTLMSWVLNKYPDCSGVGEQGRNGIVHRLDRDTSGLVVVSKNDDTYFNLKDAFTSRDVEKSYYALVWGNVKDGSGVIDKGITSIDGKRRTVEVWSQREPNKVRDALTAWKKVGDYGEFSLLDVSPKTGRMHQIRVHLSSIGHPVVCDKLYSGKKSCPEKLGRLFLHSYKLVLPYNNERIETEIPMDEELQKFLSDF